MLFFHFKIGSILSIISSSLGQSTLLFYNYAVARSTRTHRNGCQTPTRKNRPSRKNELATKSTNDCYEWSEW